MELLEDIQKETVDWVPNYDDNKLEPTVLPAKLPNLLMNGSEGIAVGMATKIPPHNLGELIDGVIALIRDPELEVSDLMEFIPGPDFPTAGFIFGRGWNSSGISFRPRSSDHAGAYRHGNQQTQQSRVDRCHRTSLSGQQRPNSFRILQSWCGIKKSPGSLI